MNRSTLGTRPRRLRDHATLRRMLHETTLAPSDLILPLFVVGGTGIERPISSLPGHAQHSVDTLARPVSRAVAAGVRSVLLFGIPDQKDAEGSAAWDPEGPVARAIGELRRAYPDLVLIADVCLCEYTSHGHCGLLGPSGDRVDNDRTLPLLARAAVAYADAGADIVAPSAMMDHQVAAIRTALDAAGRQSTAILAYAAKFASAFYGPFREAAGSTPAFGDRSGYQLAPANRREALREVALDVAEGADLVMVKPAGPYLDLVREVRNQVDLPVAAYQVSGEYAMIKAAAAAGWIDEQRAALETLTGIRRAGADLIITYYATDAAEWLAR